MKKLCPKRYTSRVMASYSLEIQNFNIFNADTNTHTISRIFLGGPLTSPKRLALMNGLSRYQEKIFLKKGRMFVDTTGNS